MLEPASERSSPDACSVLTRCWLGTGTCLGGTSSNVGSAPKHSKGQETASTDGSGLGHLASSSPRNARLSPATCSEHLLAALGFPVCPSFKLYPSGFLGRVFPKPPRKAKQITLGKRAPAPPERGAGSATSRLPSLLQAGKRAPWSCHNSSHPALPARNAWSEFEMKMLRYTPAPLRSPAWEGLCQRGSPHSPAPPLAPRDNNGDKTFPAPPGRRRGGLGGRSPLGSFPPPLRVHGGRFLLTCPKSQLRGVAAIFPASLHL